MRKQRSLSVFLSILVALGTLSREAFGQGTAFWTKKKFEITTATSYEISLLDESYFHQYSPPFLSGPYQSQGEQTISIDGDKSWGLSAGLAYFPVEKLGLQLHLEFGKPRLKGRNTPYQVQIRYGIGDTAAPPPYPFLFERSYDWPNTEGYLTQLCLSLNAIIRLPVSSKTSFSISGGPTYFYVLGEGIGLTYSKFWIDQESFFVGETYQMKFRFKSMAKFGLNLGAEFNWLIYGNVCLSFDLRFFGSTKSSRPLEILSNAILSDPLDQVKKTMNLGSVEINPSFYRAHFGLKYLF